MCAVHHRAWLHVCTSFTSHDNPMHTNTVHKHKHVKKLNLKEYSFSQRKAAGISSEASSFSCKLPMCAVHHRIWLQVCTSFTSHDNPMHTNTCAQTCQEIKSQKGLVFSEGRQHGSRQKPVASVANYPCVLFITEHDSMFAQVLPVMTIPCTPTLCININMSRN